MPQRPESDWLYQSAVLWPADGVDDFGAPKVSSTPIQICVRFEAGWRRPDDMTSDAIQADALVIVDRVIAIGSIMWQGELSELPVPPAPLLGLLSVVGYNAVPDIKQRNTYRTVMLRNFHEKLPV